jgi:IMP cyclohydrolase
MTDRDGIAQLLSEYAWANDAPDVELLRTTLAEDVRYSVSIAGEPAVGPLTSRDETVAFIADAVTGGSVQRRHLVSNLQVLDRDTDEPRVVAYLTIVQTEDGALRPVATGVYRATARRDGDRWTLASLAIELDGAF